MVKVELSAVKDAYEHAIAQNNVWEGVITGEAVNDRTPDGQPDLDANFWDLGIRPQKPGHLRFYVRPPDHSVDWVLASFSIYDPGSPIIRTGYWMIGRRGWELRVEFKEGWA